MSNKKEKPSSEKKGLKGFDIKINELGEITSNMSIDELNAFLNENVKDKKLEESKKEEE